MAYLTEESVNEFYNIISNLISREDFDKIAGINGSREIVYKLAEKAGDMTLDQLRKVTEGKWRNMAITGIAHISWEDGQWKELYMAFVKTHNMQQRKYVKKWSETWYQHTETTWTGTVDGEEIAIIEDYRCPSTFSTFSSGGTITRYYNIKPISEIKSEPDTLVCLIRIEDGNAYLTNQFAGSREECDEWATEQIKHSRGDVHIRTFSLK